LVEHEHKVTVLVRDSRFVAWLQALGCFCVPGDLLDPESLRGFTDGADCVLHLATAIPHSKNQIPDWSLNDRVRREGTANLIYAAQQSGTERFVLQSIALLHATPEGELG